MLIFTLFADPIILTTAGLHLIRRVQYFIQGYKGTLSYTTAPVLQFFYKVWGFLLGLVKVLDDILRGENINFLLPSHRYYCVTGLGFHHLSRGRGLPATCQQLMHSRFLPQQSTFLSKSASISDNGYVRLSSWISTESRLDRSVYLKPPDCWLSTHLNIADLAKALSRSRETLLYIYHCRIC